MGRGIVIGDNWLMNRFLFFNRADKFIKFLKSENEGAFAVILALMIIPLMALAGAIIDYSNASAIRAEMQVATDSAALAAAREAKDDLAKMQTIAKDVYDNNLVRLGVVENSTIVASQIENGVRVDASYPMPTIFLKFIGINKLDINIFSEIDISGSNLEVALVLDTTYSMRGSKIANLKNAAKNMVDIIMEEETDGTVKIGLVPFSRYVNIGMSNRNEPGIEVPDDYEVSRPDYCRNTYPNSTRKCDRRRETYPCVIDGVATTCSRWVYYNCTGSLGEPVWTCTPRSPQKYRWYGCVGSRDYPRNTTDDGYNLEKVPGLLMRWNNCKSNPLTRLTNVKSEIIAGINAMSARDYTYVPAGLIWGWRLLTDKYPFADAAPKDDNLTKVLVVMTDGANTISPTYPEHNGNNANIANNITEEICQNINDDGIVTYTIAFEVTDSAIKSLLQNCAGNGGSYFDASDSAELAVAFEDIADELLKLRVSK